MTKRQRKIPITGVFDSGVDVHFETTLTIELSEHDFTLSWPKSECPFIPSSIVLPDGTEMTIEVAT